MSGPMICIVCAKPVEDGAKHFKSNVRGVWHEGCKAPGSESGTYYLQSGEVLRGFPPNTFPRLGAGAAPSPRVAWDPLARGEITLENLDLGPLA